VIKFEPECCFAAKLAFNCILFVLVHLKEQEIQLPVYLMIRRGKTTIFFDAFENTKVIDLKKMLQGLTKRPPEDVRLFKENQVTIVVTAVMRHSAQLAIRTFSCLL
jgi:hypothetical protein